MIAWPVSDHPHSVEGQREVVPGSIAAEESEINKSADPPPGHACTAYLTSSLLETIDILNLSRRTLHVSRRVADRPVRLHRLNVASFVVISVLALMVSAKGVSATPGPQPIDACALLMTSELSTLLGMPVEAGVRHDAGLTSQGAYSSTCIWRVRNKRLLTHDPNASLGGADFAILDVFSWLSRQSAETFLQSFRAAAKSKLIPVNPVALDIGDDSLWWGDGVAVRRGAVSFGISVVLHSADRDKCRVWEESLAKKILARLHSDHQR